MKITRTFVSTRAVSAGRVSLVPTMGSLHQGHLALVDRARSHGDLVVVSLFVNPLQFNDLGDLDRYPRDLERDAAMCERAGVDVLFAPEGPEMYPNEPMTRVTVGEVARHMEGRFRPGHFEGVATVVVKLLAGLQPDSAIFGRKDAQQVTVVRTVAADLSFPVEIVGVSTVRESDGLAMSSRNAFLDSESRRLAAGLSRGLMAAADLVEAGERDAAILAAVAGSEARGIELDYVTLADQERAQPLATLDRPAYLAVAGTVGGVRLIDNVAFDGSHFTPDRGVGVGSEANR